MDLSELPLWRLIVLLDDAEREHGARSPQAREIVRVMVLRMEIVSEIKPTDTENES